MARPLKPRTLDSFPHPCGAYYPGSGKLEVMTLLFGNDGYAFYYRTLEAIYSQPGCILTLDEPTRRILRRRLRVGRQKFDEMLRVALDTRLFDPNAFDEGRVLTNNTIQKTAAAAFRKRDAERRRCQGRRKLDAGTTPETP